jgi:D-alanyl-D-alanine carboxypeptidase (penicillin-binding protein 5/6)
VRAESIPTIKKLAICIFAFCLSFLLFLQPVFAASPAASAKSAVLIERRSNRILYIDNGHDLLPMASTTKIMTAILAIEYGNLNDDVVVSKNASGVQGSSIWLSVGEKMKLKDMLYGLMLASGNDAAVAIAEHIGGSIDGFVKMMNLKAKEIGANNTNFSNPNGLPDESHYTTAYDLALIASYAMKNPVFCEIVCTKYKNLPWEGHEYERTIKNKNKILWQYDGGNGIKTGYTKNAGKCLVAAAQRNGMQLISVVLNDGNMFEDSMDLLDYGFNNYIFYTILYKGEKAGSVQVVNGKEKKLDILIDSDISLPLKKDEKEKVEKRLYLEKAISAPVQKGQTVGRAEIWLDGKKINDIPLKTAQAVEENTYPYNFFKILNDWLKVG